ncbi:MAG: class I SAM-dependent methyltransferase [Chloroflexota bacterium]
MVSIKSYVSYESEVVAQHLGYKNSDMCAKFLMPHLKSAMDLLDCGCGAGSITVGLASVVTPGNVVGIDISEKSIEIACQHQMAHHIPNLRFEAASVYSLPFPDGVFDAVFSHGLFLDLQDPNAALCEIWRVLKPGGIVGLRDADFAGRLLTPVNPALRRWHSLFATSIEQHGGNPYWAQNYGRLLHETGFVNIQLSASYDCYATPADRRRFGQAVAAMLEKDQFFYNNFMKLGVMSDEIKEIRSAWLSWSEDPHAFHAAARAEVVGWKNS